MSINQATEFENIIRQQIYKILQEENLLQGEWHLGKVEAVISSKMLSVYVDGSKNAQKVPCSPDVPFSVGDEIWVVYINRKPSNKFALAKRGV